MFFPDIKMEAVFTNCPPGYCKIRKGVTISKDLDPYLNKDGFLVPGLFKQAMFDLFEKSLSDGTFREGRRAKSRLQFLIENYIVLPFELQLVYIQ